jgi:hypothetical protein
MKNFITSLFLIIMTIIAFDSAGADLTKAEKFMQGTWVPQNIKSCKSSTKFEIFEEHLVIHYKADSARFGDFDLCFSCAGGAKYSGIEVWLSPDFNNPNGGCFTLRFNDGERKGIMKVDFIDKNLGQRFPFEKYNFIKCK